MREIAEECVKRHKDAYGDNPIYRHMLDVGGDYAFRIRGEDHAWTPDAVAKLQHAVRGNVSSEYRAFATEINEQNERLADHPRADGPQDGRQAGAARRGRAGRRDRQALRHRRDELRLDLARGAHDARDRHEPDRRTLEHGRGRRGIGSLQAAAERRLDALEDQAGRLGTVRRHRRISRQRRRSADQDGAGREARRGRTAARQEGRQEHRARALFDAGRGPDLAAAASRHLFDRGSGAAHPRSEERQSERAHLGQAGLRSGRRHGRRGRLQGALGPCHDLGLRRRHRRVAAHLADACGFAVGDRPCGNPADAGAERLARTDCGPSGRRPADGQGRRHRRASGRRRIRLLHRAADRRRLHHDAQVPSQHLSRSASPRRTRLCARNSPASRST